MGEVKGAHVRTRARSWALQLLYGWELGGEGPLREHARKAMARRRVADRYRPYIERLLELLEEHLEEVDALLERTIPNWRLERLTAIDRNVLRIGATEILYAEDVPGKVAITEAIRLADKYGSDESPRFVNGVLDAIYRQSSLPR